MNRLLKVILAFSLGVNALFLYRTSCSKADIDFYQTGREQAYLIKKHQVGDYFIIDHRDSFDKSLHRYTAKCQPTLTWTDGIVNPGRPMSDSCMYLPQMVGKTVAAGKMRKEGNTIVFMAWTNSDTVQTADVLTIIKDEQVE